MWSIALIGRLALSPTGLTLVAKKIWLAQFQCDRQKSHQNHLASFFSRSPFWLMWQVVFQRESSKGKSGWNYSKQGVTLKKFNCFVLVTPVGLKTMAWPAGVSEETPTVRRLKTSEDSLSKHPKWFQHSLVWKLLRWEKYKCWFMLLAQTHTLNVWLDESYVKWS